MAAAARAIQLARAGEHPYFEEGQLGDIERDALVEGLPLWLAAKAGSLYLAANASWPGLFKIGCTRKSVESRMRQLSGAGVPTPWVACQSWLVHDAHGLEAMAHRACQQWRVTGELFHASAEALIRAIDAVVTQDRQILTSHLSIYLPTSF
ncbi:hypothetical protein WJ87_05910 [Burkholderia ubonensis]|nr:hypothetical protein WJ87_05910 [Burkholderia ubonensis]